MRAAREDIGASSTEYALVAAFIVVVAVGAIAALGAVVFDLFQSGTDVVPGDL